MRHPRKQLVFAVLSLADLALTCWLLTRPGGQVYEANPVARWWLEGFGLAGLAGFKVAIVAMVLGLSLLIARTRPRAAGAVLSLGCGVTAAVVVYSAGLLPLAPQQAPEDHAAIDREARQAFLRHDRFYRGLRQKVQALIAGRLSLRAVAQWVKASERGRHPAWRRALLALHGGRPIDEACARCVVAHAISWTVETNPRAAVTIERQLHHELRRTYGATSRSPAEE